MKRRRLFKPAMSAAMAAVMAITALPMGGAQAGMIATERAVAGAAAVEQRSAIRDFLRRQDVRRQLEMLGVDPDEALARVDGMSDTEVGQAAGRLNELPAGGDAAGAIIGAAVLIFIVLLITDILGFTSIFPFTRPVPRR